MKRLALLFSGVALVLSIAACDPAPNDAKSQEAICHANRPWGAGHIYLAVKVDANSLKCWHRFDGCHTYQLDHQPNGTWKLLFLNRVTCPILHAGLT